jgi:hypothetical protein
MAILLEARSVTSVMTLWRNATQDGRDHPAIGAKSSKIWRVGTVHGVINLDIHRREASCRSLQGRPTWITMIEEAIKMISRSQAAAGNLSSYRDAKALRQKVMSAEQAVVRVARAR